MIEALIELASKERLVILERPFSLDKFTVVQSKKISLLSCLDLHSIDPDTKVLLRNWWALDKSNRSLLSSLSDYSKELESCLKSASSGALYKA